MNLKLFLFAVTLFKTIDTGYGLECWKCTQLSFDGQNCQDPFTNNTQKAKCDFGEVCVKHSTAKISYGDLQHPAIITRGCSVPGFCSSDVQDVTDHCSICSTDLCNSSKNIIPTIATFALLLIKLFLF